MNRRTAYLASSLACCVLSALSCSGSKSGEWKDHDEIVLSENLSSNQVTCFAEDRFGHVWIGTQRSLIKYSVDRYKYYYCSEKSNSIPYNMIGSLYCSSDGKLYVGTMGGACVYNEDDTFTRINTGHIFAIGALFENRNGKLLIDNYRGLEEYDPASGDCRSVMKLPNGNNVIYHTASDGTIWTNSISAIVSYDPETYQIIDSLATPIACYHSAMTKDGELWLSGLGRMTVFNTRTKKFKPLPASISADKVLMSSDVDHIFVLRDGSILFNTIEKGMFCYIPSEDRLLHQNDPSFPIDVPSFRISTIFQDSKDNVWFGSRDQGFSVSSTRRKRFNNDKILTSAFKGKSVKSLCHDNSGHLWIATLNDGIYTYDLRNRTLHNVDLHPYMDTSYGYIQCSEVFCDSEGNMWLVLSDKGYILKGRSENGDFHLTKKYFLFGATGLTEDEYGNMWIGSFGTNVFKLPHGEENWIPANPGVSGWSFINRPLPMGEGRLLICPFNLAPRTIDIGTGMVDSTFVTAESFSMFTGSHFFIENVQMVDSGGVLWIGTVENGLLRYDSKSRSLEHIAGTPCNDICAIIEDKHDNLWVSTRRGLGHYDRSSGKFINFYAEDGTGGDEYCDRSACILGDNTIVFGGTHGITMVNLRDISKAYSVPLVFETLHIQNDLVFPGKDSPIAADLSANPKITLKSNQNSFRITFSALDYSNSEKTRYSYRMEGYDKYWYEAGTVASAYYANLPSGKYVFHVKVSGENKNIAEMENSIQIEVKHAPWDTPLAWSAYFFAFFSIIGIIVLQRRHAALIKKEAEHRIMEEKLLKEQANIEREREERINKMQMSFFSNVSHEFRTPLTMISGPVSMLEKSGALSGDDKKLVSVIKTSSDWMLRLVNQLLDFNRLENDSLKLQIAKVDASQVLSRATSIFGPNAKTKNIAYITSGIDVPAIVYIDEDKVTKIVINLISNALKFTPPGGEVSLYFDVVQREKACMTAPLKEEDKDPLWVKVSVSDTGKGIPDNMKEKIFERYFQIDDTANGTYNWGTGIGLYYARTLARRHHGYLFAADRADGASGAVFTLLLPASASSYAATEMAPDKLSQSMAFPVKPLIPATDEHDGTEDPDKPLVLVVDDDIDVANYQKLLLSPFYRVKIRFNAESAMDYLCGQNEEPDMIICDVMMPGKNGYEFTKELRNNVQLSHIPVILVTAKVGMEDRIEGLDAGADAYITKPFDPEYLLTLLKTTLERIAMRKKSLADAAGSQKIEEGQLSAQDTAFMNELYSLLDSELDNADIDIVEMSAKMRISRTKFYYKIKGLTGEPPSVFFKRYKLNIAAKKLLEGKYNMSEIADMTGFSSLSHFSTSFKHQFGVPPSAYRGEKAK